VRQYSSLISLAHNDRGAYYLDPSVGCESGTRHDKNGCYGDCYSARLARIYGYDFTKTVYRGFENDRHRIEIMRQINKIGLPFIRMGNSGDPSEDWQHTLKICKQINEGISSTQLSLFKDTRRRMIVVITKHFNSIPDDLAGVLSYYNICVNTSVSAIDSEQDLQHRMSEYNRLKKYCKSVLRVVSFAFGNNEAGRNYTKIQNQLFRNDMVIDNAFRPSRNNKMLADGVIIADKQNFLSRKTLISKHNNRVYLGSCQKCPDMCGVNLK